MNQYVSQGVFDRRVKLIEEKLKHVSDTNLLNRLQAEQEDFIKRLEEIELDGSIPDYFIADYNAFKANTLRIDDVYDANGQFDGSKIKPLSISTAALTVGQRSQQLSLTGVEFNVTPYSHSGGYYGTLQWSGGSMFHYGFINENSEPKVYTITSGSFALGNYAYYIYAYIANLESTTTTAEIKVSTNQIKVDGEGKPSDFPNGYYVQLGYVSVELDSNSSESSNRYYRKVDTTYGQTTINGRLITTGRIEGSSGANYVYFDLDKGEIGGTIKFTSGNEELDIDDYLETKYTDIYEYVLGDSTTGIQKIINDVKDELEGQIDGRIDTWFGNVQPGPNVYPENEWTTTSDKDNHLGDLYYDDSTGYAYRYTKNGNNYTWSKIEDTDMTRALAIAKSAKETADGKMSVFLDDPSNPPIPPYSEGDIWVNATYPKTGTKTYNDETLVCIDRHFESCANASYSQSTIYYKIENNEYVVDDEVTSENFNTKKSSLYKQIFNIADWQSSNRAIAEVDNVTDDGIISKGSEKASLKKEFEEITGTYNKVLAAINTFGVASEVTNEKDDLDDAYDALSDVMDIILDDTNENTSISGDLNMTKQEFRDLWVAYYSAEATLNDAIQKAAQDKITEGVAAANAELSAIKGGSTTIAGGMITSNLVELKNITFTSAYGTTFDPTKTYFIYDSNSKIYSVVENPVEENIGSYFLPNSGSITSGVSGLNQFPAFWAGGSEIKSAAVRLFRNAYANDNLPQSSPYYQYIYKNGVKQAEYLAIKNYAESNSNSPLPNVFIDFDGISRFGDLYLIEDAVKWTPSTDRIKLYDPNDNTDYVTLKFNNGALQVVRKDGGQNDGIAGVYSDWISALGANSSGGGGGGGINWADFWNELNKTEEHSYSGTKVIYIDYIPNLSASKINSGTFDAARIPTLSITDKTSGTLPVNRGGTGATSAANARLNLSTWSLVSDSYNTLMPANGTSNGWVKIGTANSDYGIIPSQSGGAGSGHNYLGTSTWYWKYAYIDQIYGYLNGNISGSSTSCSGNASTATTARFLYSYVIAPVYGSNRLEYFNNIGTYGNVVANSICYPTSDWYHFLRMNHGNSNGYYNEIASSFHDDNLYWRRTSNGTAYDWKRICMTDKTIIPYPNGGTYRTSTNTVTGALKVRLPKKYTSIMVSFWVDIYNYTDNESVSYYVGGYNFSSDNTWYNCFSRCIGGNSSYANLKVRFGDDGTYCCVLIGETTTAWKYPQVIVRDVQLGYSTVDFTYNSIDWNISFVTTLPTVNKTIDTYNLKADDYSGKVNGYTISSTVNAGTANYLAYYNSSNQIDDTSKLSCDGNYLHILNDTDVGGTTTPTNAPFTIGTLTSQHIEIDNNEILSKSNGTTPSTLYLQDSTGYVEVAGSGLGVCGINTGYNLYINGTSYFNSTMKVTSTGTNRATFELISNGDYPVDLKLGRSNTAKWSLTSRNNSEGDAFYLYSYVQQASAIYVKNDSTLRVGIGTNTPNSDCKLHVVGNIYATGGVTALQAVSSDKRLKKNIKRFNAKDIINKLNPVSFEWNSKAKKLSDFKDGTNYGLIAQDSDGIIDNLVFDLPDGKGYKGVRYEKLIPILLQAVKEQQKEIDELKQIIKKIKV